MKSFENRCILLFFLFGQLITDVNQEKEIPSSGLNGLFGDERTHLHLSSVPIGNTRAISSAIESMNFSSLEPVCKPFDSCVNRCSENPIGLRYTCNCDSKCTLYADCCIDFEKECASRKHDENLLSTLSISTTCEEFFENYPMYMVSKCSSKWKNAYINLFCNHKMSAECMLSSIPSNASANDTHSNCKSFVYDQCVQQFKSKCDQVIEPKCSKLIERSCGKIALKRCKNCNPSFWPVVDLNGILYRNSFCALCNFQEKYEIPDIKLLMEETNFFRSRNNTNSRKQILRNCFPFTIDFCPDTAQKHLSEMCKNTSGLVIPNAKEGFQDVVYKNIYCALCHDEPVENLECVVLLRNNSEEPSLMQSVIKPLVMDFVTGVTSDIQGLRLDDIPAAFSMLLNFGLDGRQRVYISSEGDKALKKHQEKCGTGKIWDPFSNVCRKLHCSTEFILVDYNCVRKVNNETMPTEELVPIPDATADFVHLSFSVEMELFDFLIFYEKDVETICQSIQESFANSFNINIDRIKNVSFNISFCDCKSLNESLEYLKIMEDYEEIQFTMSLDLYEGISVNVSQSEPSVDSIVSLLASALSVNGFDFAFINKTSRIYEMHQSVDFLTSWCNADGLEKKEYWNSEFKLILNESVANNATERIRGIYIKETNKFYPKGQFVADILYQGYQFNQNLINVSGLAIVCDRIENTTQSLNESCPRIFLEKQHYVILENGSLLILHSDYLGKVDDRVFEMDENGSIEVCLFSSLPSTYEEIYFLCRSDTQDVVSYILIWISVVALIAVLLTYLLFTSLRNLPGCNTMNLSLSLLAMQMTFQFGQRSSVKGTSCVVVATILHYEILCCFTWMNVMAYDLYKTFGNKTILNNIRSKGKFLPWYMTYAYGTPLLLITVTTLLDFYLEDSMISPQYGRADTCWINNKNASKAFFELPLSLILLINIFFFVLTILSIRSVKHVLYNIEQNSKPRDKSQVLLYARMASVIGLTWLLAFVKAYTKCETLAGQVLTYLFIIFNTLQGVYLFIVFVCNRRVFDLYKTAVQLLLNKIFDSQVAGKRTGSASKLSNAMCRTVSTDTVTSTVSNSSSSSLKTIYE